MQCNLLYAANSSGSAASKVGKYFWKSKLENIWGVKHKETHCIRRLSVICTRPIRSVFATQQSDRRSGRCKISKAAIFLSHSVLQIVLIPVLKHTARLSDSEVQTRQKGPACNSNSWQRIILIISCIMISWYHVWTRSMSSSRSSRSNWLY